MIRFRSKSVREEAATGGSVVMLFGYAVLFCAFSIMYVLGEFPPEGTRAMVIAGLAGAAGNLFWLFNRSQE